MIESFYKDKTILITGGAGSIGSELCFQLLNFDISRIIVLDQSELALHKLEINLKKKQVYSKVDLLLSDIRNEIHIELIFENYQPDIVFHAAALKQLPILEKFPSEAVLTNIHGTQNMVNASRRVQVKKFIFISTDKAVEPSSILGATKQIAENFINKQVENQTKYSIIRFGNVYNSNGSAIELFNKQIECGGPITITNPNSKRYFISINRACKSIINISSISNGEETFVIDMGEPRSIVDVIKELIVKKGLILNEDIEIKTIGLRQGEKLKEKLINDYEVLKPTSLDKISYFKTSEGSADLNFHDLKELVDFAKERNESAVFSKLKKLSNLS